MCVTYEELVPEFMAYNTLRQNIKRGKVEIARRGGGEGSCALIVYASLPDKYKRKYEEHNGGTPEELYKQQQMKEKIKLDDKARAFYEKEFEYSLNGVQIHLSKKLIEEYTLNASVLNALLHDKKMKVGMRNATNNSTRDVWDIIFAGCENLRVVYGHTLPNNKARLQEKMRNYDRPMTYNEKTYSFDYLSLISGKIGNSNTIKITEEAGEQLIALKRCRKPVYNDSQIFDKFNQIAEEKEWKPLKSIRSMKQWFALPDVEPLWYDAVHGEMKAHHRYRRKHQTEIASMRDARWEGDGTLLNLYYRDKENKIRTIKVYEVIDTYSEALLGYHISESEDFWAQYEAFRMAVQATRRKPYEIVTDNQGGAKTNKMRDFMQAISRIARATAPNNPQSKTIENVFYRFQKDVLHQLYGFTGQNITTVKKTSHPNLEFAKANIDSLPTLEELKVQYAELREMWNGTRAMLTTGKILTHPKSGTPRMEMYLNSQNSEAPEITPEQMAKSFWIWTDKASTYNTDGIKFTIRKEEYRYEVFSQPGIIDHEWLRSNTYRKFWAKFDPHDMTSIELYWEDTAGEKRYSRIASTPIKIRRAIQEQTEGERAFINREQEANKQDRIARHLKAKEIEWKHGVAPEQFGLTTPKINGLTADENYELKRTIEKRTRRYRENPLSIAAHNKVVSMSTFDDLEDGEVKIDYKRVAGKL